MVSRILAITGASSIIGEATANRLAAQDASRSRRSRSRPAATGADGGAVNAWTDVTKRADLTRLAALACERFGRLDRLISNAGVMPIGPIDDLAVDDWDRTIDVDIKCMS